MGWWNINVFLTKRKFVDLIYFIRILNSNVELIKFDKSWQI